MNISENQLPPAPSTEVPAMDAAHAAKRSRRKFLFEVGASTVALSAVNSLTGCKTAPVPAAARSAPKHVRIGVVGGGFGAAFQWHLHPNCTVVAVCDVREQRIQKLKRVYKCDNGYKAYADFLKHPGLDAVALFTPAPFHVEMAVQAFQAGKHVISAVPAGMSVEELELLLATVKKTGLKYMMAETSRYRPEVMTCIDWAKQGRFGEIFYSESEYHHTGLGVYAYGPTFDCQSCANIHSIDQVNKEIKVEKDFVPTWAYAYPPMLYPTHCTGIIIPVTGERLTEVTAHGWGNDHEMLKKNYYDNNPFIHTVALFKMTNPQHSCRISIGWNIAAGGTERGMFYGDKLSYIMARPEGSPNTIVEQKFKPNNPFGPFGGEAESRPYEQTVQFERLPEPLRIHSGHGNSHGFITHEFVSAIIEDRHPEVNVWEAIAYTMPGVIAHKSALAGGACLKIKDYGKAPA